MLLDKFSKIASGLKKKHGESQLLDDLIDIGNEKREEMNKHTKKEKRKRLQKIQKSLQNF